MAESPGDNVTDPFAALEPAFAFLPDAAVVWAPEGEIVLWNKAAEALFGYSYDEARSQDVSFLSPPEDTGASIKLFSRALSGQTVEPRRVERMCKDGTRVRVSLRASPLRNEAGKIFGALFLARDLRTEEEHENRLNELHAREREIAALVPDALYVHRGGKIVWANPAAVEIFGAQSLTDLIGRSPWDLVQSEDLEQVLERNAGLSEAIASRPIFIQRKRLDGSLFPAEGRGAKLMWDGELATLMIVRDFSERERADNALAESEARQQEFAEISPDAMFVHQDGEIVFANAAALEMFGAGGVDEFVGHALVEFLHPDDVGLVVENWERTRRGERGEIIQARRLHVDGSEFVGEARHRSISWNGEDAFLVTLRDITDQIEAQAAIEKSE